MTVAGKQSAPLRRHVVDRLLPAELCQELALVHRICAVPGYRPKCTSATLLACPAWAWPALLRARELARDAAEEYFDAFGELWPETTVTVAWLPGSSLPGHSDDCRDYLRQRHISVVIWLSEQGTDFGGGEFFFEGPAEGGPHDVLDEASGEHLLRPSVGRAVFFDSGERHGLRPVTSGERLALNIWFTQDATAAEDVKFLSLLPPAPHLVLAHERLHGRGPQAEWPPGKDAYEISRLSLAPLGLRRRRLSVSRRGFLTPRSAKHCLFAALNGSTCGASSSTAGESNTEKGLQQTVDEVGAPALTSDDRVMLAFEAYRKFRKFKAHVKRATGPLTPAGVQPPIAVSMVHGLMAFVRGREQSVAGSLPDWLSKGLLAAPLSYQLRTSASAQVRLQRKRRHSGDGQLRTEVELSASVPGFAVARGLLTKRTRRRLEAAVEASLLPATVSTSSRSGNEHVPDQAMRFGKDIPRWVRAIGRRCAQLDQLLPPDVARRRPLFDQLIANSYRPGQGITRHVDLLKFDDGVLGICLGADATLTLRRLRDETSLRPGGECFFRDEDFTGEKMDVQVRAGDVYALSGAARYRWTHEIEAASLRAGARRLSLTLRRMLPASWHGTCQA